MTKQIAFFNYQRARDRFDILFDKERRGKDLDKVKRICQERLKELQAVTSSQEIAQN